MREIEVPLSPGASLPTVRRVESAAREVGLVVTLKTTLAKHPGCVHWHLKRDGERGVLEMTVWPEARRAWLSVQDGRRAEWIEDAAARLRDLLAS